MQNKISLIGPEAGDKIVAGANYYADALKMTIGPYGFNAALEKGDKITNDGATIGKELFRKDEFEQRGLHIARKASIKTAEEVGDGSSSTPALMQATLKEIIRQVGDGSTLVSKKKHSEVISQLNKETEEIVQKLRDMSEPITSREGLVASAKVSAEDDELAELIGGTQWDMGKDGIILAEISHDTKCSIERMSGIRLDNGFGATSLVNNLEKQTLETEKAKIIVSNYTVNTMNMFRHILEPLIKSGTTRFVIVGSSFSENAIKDCKENYKLGVELYPINAPFKFQDDYMGDLAATTGATYLNKNEISVEEANEECVGDIDKLVASRTYAIFAGHNKEGVDKRLIELRKKEEGELVTFNKNIITSRIAQLQGGFAILKIGSLLDSTLTYKKDKADDAVMAVRGALQEGVVPGAGLAFKMISESLPDTYILKRPLLAIYNQIKGSAPNDFVIEPWVKDPVKVLRVALSNAVETAGILSTIRIVAVNERIKPKVEDAEFD